MDRFASRGGNFASGPSAFATNPIKPGFPRVDFASAELTNKQEILQVFRVYDHKNKLMVYSNKTTDGPNCFYFWTLEPTLRCTAHRFYENEMDYTEEVIPGIMPQIGIDSKDNRIFAEDILEFDDLSFDGLMIKNKCRVAFDAENFKLRLIDFENTTSMKVSDFIENTGIGSASTILYDCEVVGNRFEGLYSTQK